MPRSSMPARAASPSPPSRSSRGTLSGDAARLALGSLFTQIAQILTLSILARTVAKNEIATYQQLNLLYGIVAPLLLAGVPTALLYFVPRAEQPDERHAWITRAYLLLGGIGVAASLAVLAVRDQLASLFNNADLADALAWYAPYLFFAFTAAVAPPALIATGHASAAARLNALVGVSTMTCVVVAVIVSPTGTALAVALSASGAIVAAASFLTVRATGARLVRVQRADQQMRRMVAYGLPLAATGLAGTLGYQFDRVVVGINFSPREFAVYALGAVEIPLGLLIATAVGNVLIPRLTLLWRDGDRIGMVALWREATRKTGLVLLPLFAFLMVMSADVIRVLYGAGYSESVDIFRIYLLLLPLRVAIWGLIPQAIGKTGVNLRAALLVLVVNACVALSLIGPLDLVGAALAAPISAVAAITYYLLWLRTTARLPVRELVPFGALAGTLAASALATAPLWAIREAPAPSVVRVAGAALVFALLAPLCLRATRMISDDDWSRLRSASPQLAAGRRMRRR